VLCGVVRRGCQGPNQKLLSKTMRVSPKKPPPKTHRHVLTAIEKGGIIQVNDDGMLHAEIGKELDIPAGTVGAFLWRIRE
jgi:CENP-B N-terminal DNA-binding domain